MYITSMDVIQSANSKTLYCIVYITAQDTEPSMQSCMLSFLHLFLTVFVCFVCFVALRPKSTAMVIARWSVHLTTLFPGQA